jgi:hypothetical protein
MFVPPAERNTHSRRSARQLHVPVHTLIVLGAPPLLGDLLIRALAPVTDVRVVLGPRAIGHERTAVLSALESEPHATVVTVDADGREGIVWRLTDSPLAPLSLDSLLTAARRSGRPPRRA